MRRTLALAAAAASLVWEVSSAAQTIPPTFRQASGPFVQRDFGFTVRTPPGATLYVPGGLTGDHGAFFRLGDRRIIDFYAEYSFVDEDEKPCKAFDSRFPWGPEPPEKVGVIEIDGHPACLATYERRDVAWRWIQQARACDDTVGIMYTILLTTTREAERADVATLSRLTDGFRWNSVQC